MTRKKEIQILLVFFLLMLVSLGVEAKVKAKTKTPIHRPISLWTLPLTLGYWAYMNLKIMRKKKTIHSALLAMSHQQPEWNGDKLLNHARNVFFEIQTAWANQDLEKLQTVLHPSLFGRWKSDVEAMKLRGEREVLENPNIMSLEIVDIKNKGESFTVCVDGVGRKVRYRGSEIVKRSGVIKFREFWSFDRVEKEGSVWLLIEVAPHNAWKRFLTKPILYELKINPKKVSEKLAKKSSSELDKAA